MTEKNELSISGQDLTKRYVVMDKEYLKEEWHPLERRIAYTDGGFGTSPRSIGSRIFGHYVADGGKLNSRREYIERLATEEEVNQAKAMIKELCDHEDKPYTFEDKGDIVLQTVTCDYCNQKLTAEIPKGQWVKLYIKNLKKENVVQEGNDLNCLHPKLEIELEKKEGSFNIFGYGELAKLHFHCPDCDQKGTIDSYQNLLIKMIKSCEPKAEEIK